MNSGLRQQLLIEASQIGDQIISQADWDNALIWKSLQPNKSDKIIWDFNEDIYRGASGIALFLLELSCKSSNDFYLHMAERAFNKVIVNCFQNPTTNYAFYTGRMGVCFVALRFFEITKNTIYLDAAFKLGYSCNDFLNTSPKFSDILNGHAGVLIGLLHLHSASVKFDNSQLIWIEDKISLFITSLLTDSNIWRQGLYWDKAFSNVQGLCGFSHGASGIGFVFLEAARYFRSDALKLIAEQGFLYESLHYNAIDQNWMDLRKKINSAEGTLIDYQRDYIKKNISYFIDGRDFNAWCHGAVGIGLARLRAYEILRDPLYKNESILAVEKTINDYIENISNPRTHNSYTLCHGHGGVADLFICAYTILEEKRFLEYAEIIGERALQVRKQKLPYYSGFIPALNTEDTSLFIGNAGVGYFMLRLIDPQNTPSITIPAINTLSPTSINFVSYANVRQTILSKRFSRSISFLEKNADYKLSLYLSSPPFENRGNEEQKLSTFINQEIYPFLEVDCQSELDEILLLEKSRASLEDGVESKYLLFVEKRADILEVQQKNILLQDYDIFLQNTLVINPNVRLLELKSNSKQTRDVLLKVESTEVLEYEISSFSSIIIKEFTSAKKIQNAINNIQQFFDLSSENEALIIARQIVKQIQELLVSNILSLQ